MPSGDARELENRFDTIENNKPESFDRSAFDPTEHVAPSSKTGDFKISIKGRDSLNSSPYQLQNKNPKQKIQDFFRHEAEKMPSKRV
jgi:hypothetical protein